MKTENPDKTSQFPVKQINGAPLKFITRVLRDRLATQPTTLRVECPFNFRARY
jgi:hypothetical protein